MKKMRMLLAATLSLGMFSMLGADVQKPLVDPAATALLKRMSDLLAASKSFTLEAHSTAEQLLASGQKAQTARNHKVAVRRPNAVAVSVTGDTDDSQMVYDGKTVSLLNLQTNTYSQTAAPTTIDETLDALAARGIVMPLADFLFADPYKALAGNLRSGQDLGIGYVFDTKCRHLAFRQEFVDWQIWIDAGEKPLPMKVVITFKESPANLEYTAFLTNWNLAADIPAATLTFTPPASAKKVDLTPATQPDGR